MRLADAGTLGKLFQLPNGGASGHRLRKFGGRDVAVCAERWQLEMLSSAGNVDQSHRRWRWWVPEGIEDNDGVKRSTLKWQSCRLFWNVLEASEVAVMPVWCGIDDPDQVWVTMGNHASPAWEAKATSSWHTRQACETIRQWRFATEVPELEIEID